MYLSALAACLPLKPYRPSDDLESFFRVVVVLFARFHVHSATNRGSLRSLMDRFAPYLHCELSDNHEFQVGASQRLDEALTGGLPLRIIPKANCRALVQLVADLAELVKTFYSSLGIDEVLNCYGPEGSGEDPGNELLESKVRFDHETFLRLFNQALEDTTGWKEKDKTSDQFTDAKGGKKVLPGLAAAKFTTSTSTSAKRASDSSSRADPNSKRLRSTHLSSSLSYDS